jgi:hypothetical protein
MIDPIELHAWADGEVVPGREEAVRRALLESREAQAELDSILALKHVLRDRVPNVECRTQWVACVARLDELDRRQRVEKLASGRFAWGLSGVLFVAILLAGVLHRGVDPSRVTSADLARIAGMFSHVHRSATSKENDQAVNELLKQANISLDQRRLDVLGREFSEVDGHVATRYLLRDATGYLNLIIVPNVFQIDETGELPRYHTFKPMVLNGARCVAWNTARGTLMLAGDRPFDDLAAVASGFH